MIMKRKLPIIRRSIMLMLSLPLFAWGLNAQNFMVQGVVADSEGSPLPGVTIIEVGTQNGTVSDLSGKFNLAVSEKAQLQFSMLSYKTVVLPAKDMMNVVLVDDALNLDEIVVVGYGTQKKANLTGAVASVRSDEVVRAQAANTSNALVGRLPGLIAKQGSGEPGMDGSEIYIRGVATYQGGTSPTYIIDGIERQAEDFARINPSDIESLNILKDAASAAIFGMRGANGVILVTTKRGSAGKTTIDYSGNVSIQSPVRLPEFAGSYDYARLINEYMGSEVYNADQIEMFRTGADPERYPDTDWYDLVLTRNAVQHNHNLSVSGGGDDIRYFTSFGYVDQGGLWDNLNYERYSLRANIDAKITKTTRLSADISGRIERRNASPQSSTDIFGQLIRNTPVLVAEYQNGLYALPDATHPNTLAYTDPSAGYSNARTTVIQTRLEVVQDFPFITKGLSLKGVLSYDRNIYSQKTWSVPPHLYTLDATDQYVETERGSASLRQENQDNEYQEYQGHLTYDRAFGDHQVSGLLMALARIENYHNAWVYRSSFDSDIMDQINAGNTDGQQLGGYDSERARVSYVGRVNYSYKNKYLFEANVRRDGSENFSPEKRWGTFASVSGGWVISEEKFFRKTRETVNFLKLRASYGTLGNDNTGGVSFPYYSRFDVYGGGNAHSGNLSNNMGDYVFGETIVKGLVPGAIANPLATWELSEKTNVGVDAAFFNMLNLSVDYFLENRSHILAQRNAQIPDSFGATLPMENIGRVRNQGIEAMISLNHKIGNVRFSIGGNITYARNKILEMAEAEGVSDLMRKTGRPIHSYYGYKTDGIFQSYEEIEAYAKQEVAGVDYATQPGDIKYVNVDDSDNVVNANDRTYLGYGNVPEIVYGINGSLNWKFLDFSFLFQGAGHVQVHLTGGVVMPYYNSGNLPEFWVTEHWSEANPEARYPRLANSTHNFPNTDFDPVQTYLYDASYIRLKNIELGFTLPQKWLRAIRMQYLRIYVSGQNLLTFSKVPQIDPENIHNQGWTYPQMKSFNIGVNVKF